MTRAMLCDKFRSGVKNGMGWGQMTDVRATKTRDRVHEDNGLECWAKSEHPRMFLKKFLSTILVKRKCLTLQTSKLLCEHFRKRLRGILKGSLYLILKFLEVFTV